jgi:hypothetical protein
MDTDGSPAIGTGPPFLFAGKKNIHSGVLDNQQIINNAHVVSFPVSFIHMRQPLTGKLYTGEAKLRIQVPTVLYFAV